MVTGPWIQTYSRKAFHLLAPSPDEVCVEDIAHSLALKCRYTGHSRWHYSVAQHCVLGARHMPTPRLALAFLLHELGEVWLPDVASPLKPHVEWIDPAGCPHRTWRELEDLHTRVALQALGLTPLEPDIHSGEVHNMDLRMLMTEAPILLGDQLPGWGTAVPQGCTPIAPLSPHECPITRWYTEQAEASWLDAYAEYLDRAWPW